MPNDDRPGFYALNVTDNLNRLSAIGAVSLIQENERFARENRLLEANHRFYQRAFGELRELVGAEPDFCNRDILAAVKSRIERDRFALDKYSDLLDQMGRSNEALRAEIADLKEGNAVLLKKLKADVTAVRPAGSRKRK